MRSKDRGFMAVCLPIGFGRPICLLLAANNALRVGASDARSASQNSGPLPELRRKTTIKMYSICSELRSDS